MDWREFRGGWRQRGNGRCDLDSIEKVFSGVEGEDNGKNGDGQDNEEHAEEQPENEEFPCTIGVDAKGYAETEDGE